VENKKCLCFIDVLATQRIRERPSGRTKIGGVVGNHGWRGGQLRIGDDGAVRNHRWWGGQLRTGDDGVVGLGARSALEDFGRAGLGPGQAGWPRASFNGARSYYSSGPGPVNSFLYSKDYPNIKLIPACKM
jgi:hypothetical protein